MSEHQAAKSPAQDGGAGAGPAAPAPPAGPSAAAAPDVVAARAAAPASARLAAARPLFRIALEVLLISAGVFLGLAGEQWRERASERSLAESSLRRFRSELRKNRDSVAAVKDKHVTKLQNLQAYFQADRASQPALAVPDTALDPAFFEYAAWEVALATQALAYMDPDLALSIAHVYAAQRQLDELTRAITQSMYLSANTTSFLHGVATYFGDCTLHEPRLLGIYDEMLARIDRALGEPRGAAAGAH